MARAPRALSLGHARTSVGRSGPGPGPQLLNSCPRRPPRSGDNPLAYLLLPMRATRNSVERLKMDRRTPVKTAILIFVVMWLSACHTVNIQRGLGECLSNDDCEHGESCRSGL